jgi:hypothetical protein
MEREVISLIRAINDDQAVNQPILIQMNEEKQPKRQIIGESINATISTIDSFHVNKKNRQVKSSLIRFGSMG